MQDSRPSLYAYIITSLFVLVFYVLRWEDFIMVVKPVIVPAIYYYYIQTTKSPINILFSVALWLFFIADMIEVVDGAAGIYLIMSCGLLSYLIMFRFAIRDKVRLATNWKSAIIAISIFTLVAIPSAYVILNTNTTNTVYFDFFTIYAIILISMFCYAIIRVFSSNDTVSRLFLAVVSSMLLSDFLYAYTRYVEFYMVAALVSFVAQFISYYWMVEYFNTRQSARNTAESH